MDIPKNLEKDFEFVSGQVEGILLYGSHAKGSPDKRSDIDVCIVNPKSRDVLLVVFAKLGGKYDVKIFEDLPLYIKIDVIRNHKVVYGNEVELSHHFYRYRKLWRDQEHRIKRYRHRSAKEMFARREKWLEISRKA